MAKVKFNRGLYSKSIVDSLKDGELFFDTNTDTTAAAGNQGIYMGVAQSDGTVKPVKVAIGAKQYMTLIDNTFLRGKELGSNIFMYTDDTDTGLRFAPMVRTGRSGFSLIAGVAGTDNDIFDTTKRAYSLAQIWGGESFGGKITLDGWSEGLKSIKSGEPPDILSFFFPHGFDITSERPGDNTVWDSIVGVYHCKGNYGISNENGNITDVTGLFIDPAKTTNARVGVVINGKTNDDLLTANGSTVSASGFLKNTASAVGTANLSDGAVTTAKIAQEAVTESKIADGAVTKGKLATALQTTIDGAVQGNTLTPILKEIDLTGTDAERKAKLDQFEADWKALTGSDTLKGARFVALSLYDDTTMQGMASYDAEFNAYRGILGDANDRLLDARVSCSSGSLTITPLFQHLEAITIYTDNTSEHMQANLDNIAAYEANLQALGVDTTKSPMIPIHIPDDDGIEIYSGFVIGNPSLQTYYSGYIEKESTPGRVYKGILIDGGLVYLTTFADQNNVVDKSLNVKSLESVVIYTDNTIEHKSQNIKNIQAYEANLKSLGVDTANGFEFLGLANGYNIHFVKSRNPTYQFFGIQTYNEENYTTWINTDGRYTESSFSNLYTSRSLNAKSLEAVTIKTSNSDADKAANVAAIKAYVNNLKNLGVDVTKGYMIPVIMADANGFVTYSGDPTSTFGLGFTRTPKYSQATIIRSDGTAQGYLMLDAVTAYSSLTTTSKQIVGAINEVNAAVKTKASNIKDASSTGGINQAFDGGETLDVTSKNPNATALDSTITGALTRGATGQYASSFGGKSIAMGKRSFAEGTTTIAKGNYSHAEGDNSVALGSDSHVEGYQTTTGPSAMGAHAEGNGTQSLGAASHSEGSSTIAKGNTSHAEGADTKANGVASHAEGNGTKGDGNYSHAEGNGTSAIGSSSHAEGYITIAQGDMSHAEGALTKAIGSHSHTEGSNNTTNAGNSHAEGANNTVNNSKYTAPSGGSSGSTGSTEPSEPADFNIEEHYGEGGHAEGMYNNAYGYASHAEGAHNKSKAHYSHTEGQGNDASGEGAHAEGWSTVASGVHSHSEGQGTKAIGDNAHAEGNGSKATGSGSHAEGSGTAQGDNAHAEGASIANNSNAHAEGLSTTASGNGAHSEGHYTQATNNAAHAEGVHTTANGDGSHTEGWYTTAKNRAEHAEGFFNFSNSVSPSYYTEGNNTLHSVGIGTSASDRKNALEIMQNGDIYAYGVGGYDGTNAVNNASKTLKTVIESKQDKLVSGTNIKTVNGQSLLGSGDITVSGGKKSVTIAIDNLLDTESFTLTADQAAAFADPDTDIMIESDSMILPLHIYYMQPGDTTKVYARVYDGDILGALGQGTDVLMFMIDGTTLTIQNAILPYKLVLSTTQSDVTLAHGGDTLFTKLSTCDIHDITIDVGGLGFVYLPVLYRGKATDDEYTFVYHNYLDSTAGYAYHAIVMTKTSDNVTFEVTTVTNSLTDTEIANIWDSVS